MHQTKSMADWLALFGRVDIPVLRHTTRDLERLHANQGLLNASSIANVVTDDPLMTVKLLRYMQMHKRNSQAYELVDVKQMLLMLGLDSFFWRFPRNRWWKRHCVVILRRWFVCYRLCGVHSAQRNMHSTGRCACMICMRRKCWFRPCFRMSQRC